MWQNKFVREGDKVRNLRKTYLLEFLDLATFRLNVRGEALICLLTSPFLAISYLGRSVKNGARKIKKKARLQKQN